MRTMLIAAGSETITSELKKAFQDKYQVFTSDRGDETLHLLQDLMPDILIINLSLSHITGLSVLQQTIYKPPIVIALASYFDNYIIQSAQSVCIDALIGLPCTIKCIEDHLERLSMYK